MPGRSRPGDAGRTVTDTAVEILQARGEPARYERLLGEILVGLDRAGQLRRLVGLSPIRGSRWMLAAGSGARREVRAPRRTARRLPR